MIHYSQCNLLFKALMLSVEPWLIIFVWMENTPAIFSPVTTKSSPCDIPEMLCPSKRNKFVALIPKWYPQLLRSVCQLPAVSRVPYVLFFNNPILQRRLPFVLHLQSHQHGSLSLCVEVISGHVDVPDGVCLFVVRCDGDNCIQRFQRKVTAYKSWPVSAFESFATIRCRICMGSSSNALFVSIHFVSTGVT